ncbi:MAG: hypothetical protein JW990_21640 [Thermoleophilia bacterium]|nr:hypothetical protein [Thermoleophilia bacterium]
MRIRHWQPRHALSALPVRVDHPAQEAGLAPRLIDLVHKNIQRRAGLRAHFDHLQGEIAIKATDTQVAVTLEFLGGKLLVHDGVPKRPDLVIWGPQSALLQSRAFLCGRVRVKGRALLLKPMLLPRLFQLMSAVEPAGLEEPSEQLVTLGEE